MRLFNICIVAAALQFTFSSCDNNETNTASASTATTKEQKSVPDFNAENAYQFIAKQVSFGPRVPNTKGQEDCANWLESQLKNFADTVYRQETTLLAGDKKTKLKCINLIASINPSAPKRILMLAHWDTRPWADRDEADKNKPIDGADDGGSGTAVLMELAQTIKQTPLHNSEIGIDILLADVEDFGKPEWGDSSYALGTQYWARNPHVPGYKAMFGILLDMVGGNNAQFRKEGYSREFAPKVLQMVWSAARQAGYSSYFLDDFGPYISDDHVPVNEIIKIPTIDIINLPTSSTTGFVQHWHTHNDKLENIDKSTLKAVGQTLLHFLYNF